MKTKSNLNRKFLLFATLFLLVVNFSLGLVLTKESTDAMKEQIGDRMLDVSNTAASMLDGDVLRDIQAEDADTPEYKEILETLTFFQDNIELKYIYCIRDMGNKEFVFTVDPTVIDPGIFGDPIVYTDALYQASLGKPSVDKVPYEDDWGRFYSAYSPVFDSNGKVSGIVAVDFSAEWYDDQIRTQAITTIVITVISLLIASVILILVGVVATKRFHKLYLELNALSDGIETLANELAGGEEIEGYELLHPEEKEAPKDEISAISKKVRSLQKYMGMEIAFVRAQAYKDMLTGLENRTAYTEYIEKLENKIKNKVADFTVAMFDINGLKQINDTEGHDAGDVAINKAADILRESFPDERIFRIGGDEFVVILNKTGAEIERLMEGFIKRYDDLGEADKKRPIMSVGYAEHDPDTDHFYCDTFERADQNMYENKKAYYEQFGNRRSR